MCRNESQLMGHGGDVKTVDWHGRKSLIASGSKDGLIKVTRCQMISMRNNSTAFA